MDWVNSVQDNGPNHHFTHQFQLSSGIISPQRAEIAPTAQNDIISVDSPHDRYRQQVWVNGVITSDDARTDVPADTHSLFLQPYIPIDCINNNHYLYRKFISGMSKWPISVFRAKYCRTIRRNWTLRYWIIIIHRDTAIAQRDSSSLVEENTIL